MKSNRTFKNTVIYGLAPQITKALSVAVLPFITPYLTTTDYGVAGVVMAVTAAISIFSTLGLAYILMLYYYKSPSQYKWIWREVYGFLRIWQIFFAIIQSFILYFFLPPEADDNFFLISGLLGLPFVIFSASSFIGFNLYRFKENAIGTAYKTIVAALAIIILNILTIRYMKLGYLGWFISMAVSDVLLNALYYFPLKFKYKLSPIYNFKRKTIREVIKKSLPLLPHYYSIYLLEISDRVVMKILNVPTPLIGKYNVAATFGSYFSNFHMAVGNAIGPAIFSALKKQDYQEVKKSLIPYFYLTLALTFTFGCWAKEIVSFLFRNEDFNTLYILSIGIVMAYNYRPYYILVNQYLSYNEKVKYLPYVTFVPGVLNVILNFVFIPLYGLSAAVISTLICYTLMGFAPFLFSKIQNLLHFSYNVLVSFMAMAILTILAYLATDLTWLLKSIINISVFLFLYILSKKLIHEKYTI